MSEKNRAFSISHDLPQEFEWDENKNDLNIKVHVIDFIRAKEIWIGDVLKASSNQHHHGEIRYLVIGTIGQDERIITVVFTCRGEIHRIISARRARDNERKYYQNAFGRGT